MASRSSDPADTLLTILKNIEQNGNTEAAIRELELFIYANPKALVTDEALFRLADIQMERKDFESASKTYGNLLFKYPDSRFTIDALYGLGYCQYRFGQLTDAITTLESVVSNRRTPLTIKAKAEIILAQIYSVATTFEGLEGESGEGNAVGAILPLRGDYAEFGERALRGILLAANVFGGTEEPVEVYVRDLGEDKSSAKMVVYELSRLERVKGLVGLLLRSAAPEVAKRSQQRRIPIVALSQREGLPRAGNYVFRSFMTLSKQAETLADYAFNDKGYRRFAILSPRNTYGRKLAGAFKEEVIKLGGEVVSENTYVVGKSDFALELKELFKLETFERLEGRRLIRESAPGVEADALFIPDNYDAVGQIAPYLAFYGIEDVALLGSNGWNSPYLTEVAEGHVEGAVFVDGFFASSEREATVDFVKTFSGIYGYEPGLLEAESYDAAMLLLKTMGNAVEPESRTMVKEALNTTEIYKGATGDIYFDQDGEAQKELFLLTVEEGKIKEAVRVASEDEIEGLGEDGAEGEAGVSGSSEDDTDSIRILDYLMPTDDDVGSAEALEPLPTDELILEKKSVDKKIEKSKEKKKKKKKRSRRRKKRTWSDDDPFDDDLF
jgi:ABC-type branched-subunit amino acid transport system substrate-binding protein